jgi:hypothetical protein
MQQAADSTSVLETTPSWIGRRCTPGGRCGALSTRSELDTVLMALRRRAGRISPALSLRIQGLLARCTGSGSPTAGAATRPTPRSSPTSAGGSALPSAGPSPPPKPTTLSTAVPSRLRISRSGSSVSSASRESARRASSSRRGGGSSSEPPRPEPRADARRAAAASPKRSASGGGSRAEETAHRARGHPRLAAISLQPGCFAWRSPEPPPLNAGPLRRKGFHP